MDFAAELVRPQVQARIAALEAALRDMVKLSDEFIGVEEIDGEDWGWLEEVTETARRLTAEAKGDGNG